MDSGSSLYEKLLAQSKSNDVDVKVDALTKLAALFERGGVEVPDIEALINVLKAALRTSNLHLTNAALSAIPIILPAIISRPAAQHTANHPPSSSTSSVSVANNLDVGTLRLALTAFLPAGGVIDRLGEKEKTQVKARETLVILGGYAFRASPTGGVAALKASKGHEPPIAIFERFMKEGGLASKVWKVREQSVLTLSNIRRTHHLFPIRPYLSVLVDCLEDTDSHVRDVARVSVVELFTGPGVSDAARADLKKEMTKKGVRKTIVDGVLAKLLGASSNTHHGRETPENGESTGRKEYVPPSLALQGKRPLASSQSSNGMGRTVSSSSTIPRPASRAAMVSPPPPATPTSETAEISAVYIASAKDLENEFAAMAKPFEGKETEHNWSGRDQAITRVRGMLKGEAHLKFPEPFFVALKEGFMQWSTKTLLTLRTTVALNTCSLYSEMAMALGHQLDPHVDIMLTNLLKMAGFTKKITAQQSQATVGTIITQTSAQPRTVISILWNTLQEKVVQARAYVVGHFKTYLEVHGHRSRNAIENSGMLETLEKALKKALADANPAAKEQARVLFWLFQEIWPEHGAVILDGLDATARKQLEKVRPSNKAAIGLPPITPQVPKKTSIAAAIAASRAKAKAIATAPPSLRHQATSSSHIAAPRRAGSPSISPKNSTSYVRPSSPQNHATPVPRRVVSTTNARTTSAIPMSHTRTLSNGSGDERSHSPSLSDSGMKRRLSSPLVNNQSSITRKATQTALPPSPPSTVNHVSPPRQTTSRTLRTPLNPNRNMPVPVPPRPSISAIFADNNDSLLMAQSVPIPDDTDSDEDESINLMSFSAPFEAYPPVNAKPSPNLPLSPMSDSQTSSLANTLSSSTISDISSVPVVEDVLRGRAQQAESAAERLLELVEPEDEYAAVDDMIPASLTNSSYGLTTPKPKPKPISLTATRPKAPSTPNNRASAIMKQAALFMDSPAPSRNSRSSSLLDVLQRQSQESGWWLKRKILLAQPELVNSSKSPGRIDELNRLIAELEDGSAGIESLKRLTLICMQLPAAEQTSPPLSPLTHPNGPMSLNFSSPVTLAHDVWGQNNTFDKFFNALMHYLNPERAEDELTYGLIVAYEVLESQSAYIEGKEADLFLMILRIRFSNKIHVLEGTNAIRDALTSKADPVYGLTTMHSCLKLFHSEEAPASSEGSNIKASTYAFGLMALGKFILRLPAEIAEEELPRLKATLITSLNDKSSLIVREAAAAAIIAAQVVLRDETHLFTLLDGLADEKKNLLTYLFDKHGARGNNGAQGPNGVDKLEKEIRRLDTRTSTPLRGGL